MARWGRFLAVHASLAASLLLAIAFATAQQLPPTAKSLPAQQHSTRSTSPLTWSTDSATAHRFVSVHGRSAAIFGSADAGLEIWTYPTQIFSGFTVSFRHQGTSTAFDGRTLLRRIVYRPESVTRIYAGPDFIVREKLFVPLNLPGAILRYEVDSTRPVDIVIGFVPVLDLMWPGSLGGQDVLWDSAASGYRLFEPTHRFTAMITSADIVAHDDTPNTTLHPGHSSALAFTLRAGANKKTASVLIAGSAPGQDARDIARQLADDTGSFVSDAVAHYDTLLRHSLQIETPDAEANRALSWAEIALDQAWVCNPDLGCGLVAGYGPSRRARRPQYDWFFAGDGWLPFEPCSPPDSTIAFAKNPNSS